MQRIYKKIPHEVRLGYGEEENSREVRIDISEMLADLPEGKIKLVAIRPRTEDPYLPANVRQDGESLVWEPDAYDMQYTGAGGAVIALTAEDGDESRVLRSHVITTFIGATISLEGAALPDPWESYLASLSRQADRAETAAEAAEQAAEGLAGRSGTVDAMAASYAITEIPNAVQPIFDPVSTDNNAGAIVSDIITPTDGHLYFGYTLATIAGLTGYTDGHMCLRFINTGVYDCLDKIAGNSAQPLADGELELYGTFTPADGKSVKALLRSFNSGSSYTYTATVSKLYLWDLTAAGITEEEALALARSGGYAAEKTIGELKDGIVGREQLAEEVRRAVPAAESAVVDCWGDSLTQGTGANQTPYPAALAALLGSGFTVNNCGVGGERAEDVAFRQGGLPAICQPVTIGSGASDKNYITVRSLDGADMTATMGQGTGSGTVYLGGDKFLLRRDSGGVYLLMGDGAEAGRVYDRPTLLQAEGAGTEHIAVIMIGQNGWGDGAARVQVTGTEDGIVIEHAADPATLANVIDAMIAHNNGPFIVCGIPSGSAESRRTLEGELGSRYGEHFVNTREYISAYGLADAGLTPTAADAAAMAKGEIPPQLKSDSVHLTDAGMASLAKCIHARGVRLGYWEVS